MKKLGNVKSLPSDWLLYDIKQLETYFKEVDGISDVKRIILKKSSFIYNNYQYEKGCEVSKTLLKKRTTAKRKEKKSLKIFIYWCKKLAIHGKKKKTLNDITGFIEDK
nr:unnamed protein product [Callosobruchus analis]